MHPPSTDDSTQGQPAGQTRAAFRKPFHVTAILTIRVTLAFGVVCRLKNSSGRIWHGAMKLHDTQRVSPAGGMQIPVLADILFKAVYTLYSSTPPDCPP